MRIIRGIEMKRCLFCGKKVKGRKKYCNDIHRVYYHRRANKRAPDNKKETILSLCDLSGAWSQPYVDAGYNVIRIDMERDGQDVRLLEKKFKNVYGILAAPPCTHLASSGAAWWRKKGENALLEGLSVVDACMRIILIYRPKFWALENPVGRLKYYLGEPRLIFNPCDYGDPYTKKTCLWGKFNIPKPERVEPVSVKTGHHSIDYYATIKGIPLGKNRAKVRSVTPRGFAEVFFKVNR